MWYSIVLFDFQDIHELDIDWGVAADYGEDVDGGPWIWVSIERPAASRASVADGSTLTLVLCFQLCQVFGKHVGAVRDYRFDNGCRLIFFWYCTCVYPEGAVHNGLKEETIYCRIKLYFWTTDVYTNTYLTSNNWTTDGQYVYIWNQWDSTFGTGQLFTYLTPMLNECIKSS